MKTLTQMTSVQQALEDIPSPSRTVSCRRGRLMLGLSPQECWGSERMRVGKGLAWAGEQPCMEDQMLKVGGKHSSDQTHFA